MQYSSRSLASGFYQPSRRRRPWSLQENHTLLHLVHSGRGTSWAEISSLMTTRSPKQCRDRYHQYLKPGLQHGPMSPEEAATIVEMVSLIGPKWATIARRLHGRSENAVKNWWKSRLNQGCRKPSDETSMDASSAQENSKDRRDSYQASDSHSTDGDDAVRIDQRHDTAATINNYHQQGYVAGENIRNTPTSNNQQRLYIPHSGPTLHSIGKQKGEIFAPDATTRFHKSEQRPDSAFPIQPKQKLQLGVITNERDAKLINTAWSLSDKSPVLVRVSQKSGWTRHHYIGSQVSNHRILDADHSQTPSDTQPSYTTHDQDWQAFNQVPPMPRPYPIPEMSAVAPDIGNKRPYQEEQSIQHRRMHLSNIVSPV